MALVQGIRYRYKWNEGFKQTGNTVTFCHTRDTNNPHPFALAVHKIVQTSLGSQIAIEELQIENAERQSNFVIGDFKVIFSHVGPGRSGEGFRYISINRIGTLQVLSSPDQSTKWQVINDHVVFTVKQGGLFLGVESEDVGHTEQEYTLALTQRGFSDEDYIGDCLE